MSKYYDSGAPFSLDNWNLLIADVNNILQNPPEDSNCEPIDTIEAAGDPHLWSVDDIEEVRNKLKETCPDIRFQEDLQIWRPEIVDEIEAQMENAWCDCEGEANPDEFTLILGNFGFTPCNAVMNTEQMGVVEGPISPVCQKVASMFSYEGPWYPHVDNSGLLATVGSSYETAYEAVRQFLIAMNQLPEIAESVESEQRQCDYYTNLVYADIARVVANPDLYSLLAPRICANGQTASNYQAKVDEKVEEFSQLHRAAMLQAQTADAAAVENFAAALSLVGRFPPDRNLLVDAAGVIPAWNWYDWWDPESMEVLSKVSNHIYNSMSQDTQRYGVYTSVRVEVDSSVFGTATSSIRYSPNGTCYIGANAAKSLVRDYTKPYYNYRSRWRCEGILSVSCEPEPGICNWWPWEDHGAVWWYDDMEAGHLLFSALDPKLWWKTYAGELVSLTAKRPTGVKNNAQKRDRWLQKYLDWYQKHPQYDDRHEAYC